MPAAGGIDLNLDGNRNGLGLAERASILVCHGCGKGVGLAGFDGGVVGREDEFVLIRPGASVTTGIKSESSFSSCNGAALPGRRNIDASFLIGGAT